MKLLALLATIRGFVAPVLAALVAVGAFVRANPLARLAAAGLVSLGLVASAHVLPVWPGALVITVLLVVVITNAFEPPSIPPGK